MDVSSSVSREPPAVADDDDRSKRARLAAITFEHGEEDPVEFTAEDCEVMYNHDCDLDERFDEEPTPNVPLDLYRPYGPEEPSLAPTDLEALDSLADQHEISRLLGMHVLKEGQPLNSAIKVLSTRFVRTWRVKPHPQTKEPAYLRRSRLVAREFARDDPSRSGLYSPASQSQQLLTRLLPAVWSSRPDHVMCSLDVADAYLCVDQPSEMWVSLYGGQYQLLKLLPGQREGSARWYDLFSSVLAEAGATAWPACPALFRLQNGQGAGLTHVDDLLGEGKLDTLEKLTDFLCSRFSCSVQFLVKLGDSISFLKREHTLTSDNMLVIRSHPKHLERLIEVTGLRPGCAGKKTPLPLQLPDLTASPSLSAEVCSKYKTAIGILLYVQAEIPHCQYAIKTLSQHLGNPTEACWSALKHLVRHMMVTAGWALAMQRVEKGVGAADMLYVGAALEVLSGEEPSLHLFCDSSSARQLAARKGCGKIRHLQLKLLWLQDKIAASAFQLHPVPTKDNLSDLMTKSLRAERQAFLLYYFGMVDTSTGYGLVGADQVRSDDDREALKIAIRAIRQAKGNPQQMTNILRVLSLVSMLDSVSALSLAAPEVDWCSQGMLRIFRRISGWVAHADASDEHHSCDGEQLEQQARADNERAGEDLPTDAHEGWDYEDYAEWLTNLDAQEYRRIFNISEPGSDEPDFTSVWGNEHVPDEHESGNAHDAARGSDEPPATGASTHVQDDDEPLVYLTKYGRKIHAMPHCAALHNSRSIEAMRLSAALRRYPTRGWCSLCHG
ncbi:RE2 [Symbiodinium sp. KB8]|nr:RE2 [Symbiodinium sp. KB8]